MSKQDVFSKLTDEWYTDAQAAEKWKGRFSCCGDLYEITEPLAEGTLIKGGKKAEKGVGYLIQWLDIEQHVFTRVKICQILTKLVPGMDPSLFEKKHGRLAAALMKQWVEKKVYKFVSPILIDLWIKVGEFGKWGESINFCLQSANPIVRCAFWTFLCDAAEKNPIKARDEYKKILKSGELLDGSITDIDNRNNDCKREAIRFVTVVSIFMAKEKDKKFIKKINGLCDENPKLKSQIDSNKETIRASMKKNASALKKLNAPKGGGDDEKQSGGGSSGGGGGPKKSKKRSKSPQPPSVAQSSSANVQYVANAASNEEVNALKDAISAQTKEINDVKEKCDIFSKFMDDEMKSRNKRRIVVGTGASIHDLFENFLLNTIGMPHYLERFKSAGANDIRMVEHFDVPFLKETIGVQNKLEGKLLVKFIGKFNEETMQFREWLKKQNVMRAYVNTFESKGIITWGILSDYCETIEAVQDAFRIKNKAHAHFLYTQLERYRNGELSDADDDDDDSDTSDSRSGDDDESAD